MYDRLLSRLFFWLVLLVIIVFRNLQWFNGVILPVFAARPPLSGEHSLGKQRCLVKGWFFEQHLFRPLSVHSFHFQLHLLLSLCLVLYLQIRLSHCLPLRLRRLSGQRLRLGLLYLRIKNCWRIYLLLNLLELPWRTWRLNVFLNQSADYLLWFLRLALVQRRFPPVRILVGLIPWQFLHGLVSFRNLLYLVQLVLLHHSSSGRGARFLYLFLLGFRKGSSCRDFP